VKDAADINKFSSPAYSALPVIISLIPNSCDWIWYKSQIEGLSTACLQKVCNFSNWECVNPILKQVFPDGHAMTLVIDEALSKSYNQIVPLPSGWTTDSWLMTIREPQAWGSNFQCGWLNQGREPKVPIQCKTALKSYFEEILRIGVVGAGAETANSEIYVSVYKGGSVETKDNVPKIVRDLASKAIVDICIAKGLIKL